MKWYYSVGGQVIGPVDRSELEALFRAGTISTSTQVIQEGMYSWVPFVDLKKTTQFLSGVGVKPATKPPAKTPTTPATETKG